MSLFRLDASIRTEGSHSRRLADLAEREWVADHPGAPIVRREIGTTPLPANAWPLAAAAGSVDPADRSQAQAGALDLARELTDELVAADALLLAVPLYNFGVSQHFKTWVDLVLTDERMLPGAPPVLAGKPAILATVRGGAYGPGTPREGWDHATGWMRRILADVWQLDLTVVEAEFTLAGHNPALDEFRELAARLHATADDEARASGRALGRALAAAA